MELQAWRHDYDAAAVIIGPAELGTVEWTSCMCSDLSRAVVTARHVFRGPIESTALLREVEFGPFQTGRLRLPIVVWRLVLSLSWATGHRSQRACRNKLLSRVAAVADQLECGQGNTLVVSHAGIMGYLSRELRARGFSGPKLRLPVHAKVHVYHRHQASKEQAVVGEGGAA